VNRNVVINAMRLSATIQLFLSVDHWYNGMLKSIDKKKSSRADTKETNAMHVRIISLVNSITKKFDSDTRKK
jgi:hypothetical protein